MWTGLSDAGLLAQCEVDTYRASGPGGQKRNKTSSAVRIRHLPSGLIVIAEESRSQHENRERALSRLKKALYLKIRESIRKEALETIGTDERIRGARSLAGRIEIGKKDPRFWPLVGLALDLLDSLEGRIGETAQALGISTGNLNEFFNTEPKVWEQVNIIRQQYGLKPLRDW
jgi:hypothetical protein